MKKEEPAGRCSSMQASNVKWIGRVIEIEIDEITIIIWTFW